MLITCMCMYVAGTRDSEVKFLTYFDTLRKYSKTKGYGIFKSFC